MCLHVKPKIEAIKIEYVTTCKCAGIEACILVSKGVESAGWNSEH